MDDLSENAYPPVGLPATQLAAMIPPCLVAIASLRAAAVCRCIVFMEVGGVYARSRLRKRMKLKMVCRGNAFRFETPFAANYDLRQFAFGG